MIIIKFFITFIYYKYFCELFVIAGIKLQISVSVSERWNNAGNDIDLSRISRNIHQLYDWSGNEELPCEVGQ